MMSRDLSQETIDSIIAALLAGSKIEAIKIHRAATGYGLKESKDFIEALIPRLIQEDPEKYGGLMQMENAGGCSSSAAVMLIAISGMVVAAATAIFVLIR